MKNFDKELSFIFGENDFKSNKSEISKGDSFDFSDNFKLTHKEAQVWLDNELKDKKSTKIDSGTISKFEQGKLYIFKYNAETGDKMSYWDKHPIAIIFGSLETTKGKVYIGINLSWYPLKARLYFLKMIRLLYKEKFSQAIKSHSNDAKNQIPIVFDLYSLKTFLDDKGFSFGIRAYKIENIINPVICVSYENWKYASRLDLPPIYPELQTSNGYSIFKIYFDFIDYIKKMSIDKNSRLKKMAENKLKGKYNLKR